MNTIKWEALKEKALSLVQKGLIFPYEYKQSFGKEDIPSDEELKGCRKLINLAENYRMSPYTFTQYFTEDAPNLGSFPNPPNNFQYEHRRSIGRRGR